MLSAPMTRSEPERGHQQQAKRQEHDVAIGVIADTRKCRLRITTRCRKMTDNRILEHGERERAEEHHRRQQEPAHHAAVVEKARKLDDHRLRLARESATPGTAPASQQLRLLDECDKAISMRMSSGMMDRSV
jgi:hypothetical protein